MPATSILKPQLQTRQDGTRGCLDSLARRYSEELKTHYRDVMDRLEELRRRRVAIDIPPLPLDLGNFKQRTTSTFKPGKYSPSSCLNDQEEENIYGLYQGQTSKEVNVDQAERYLSPRSKSFYQPSPFTTADAKSEKPFSNGTKKKGGLGKLFRSFGAKKDKCKEKKSRKSEKNVRKLQLPCKSPCSKNHVEDVPSAPVHQFQIQIGEEERDQLMMMVRDGYMTMEQAVQKILTDLGRGVGFSAPGGKKGPKKPTAVFYSDGNGEAGTSFLSKHIYYEPPEDLDLDMDQDNCKGYTNKKALHYRTTCKVCCGSLSDLTQPLLNSEHSTNSLPVCSQEEFTKIILSKQDKCIDSNDVVNVNAGEPQVEDFGSKRCSPPIDDRTTQSLTDVTSAHRLIASDIEIPSPGKAVDYGQLVQKETKNIICKQMVVNHDFEGSIYDDHCCSDGLHHTKCRQDSFCHSSIPADNGSHSKFVSSENNDTTPKLESTEDNIPSSLLKHRSKDGMLGKIQNLTNRTSYSTSEEGQSQSSDYEETEESEKKMESGLSRDHIGRSSLAGRVRELHRDVRRRFSRLKSSRGMTDTEQLREPVDQQDGITRPGSSLESLPSENGSSSRCSLQTQTPSSSNRSSTSVGEDEGTPYIGPFLGRARALTDYTPSPYDKDALAFKKGDVIDIIAKHNTGIWVGMLHGRVGSFKFINVEELRKEVRHRQLRFKKCTQLAPLAAMKPQTLEDILQMVGLEQYTHILVLNGYKHLDSFKDIEIEDLEGLGILEPDHQQQLLRAADMLLECEATPSLATHPEHEEPVEETYFDKEKNENTGRDSGCYTGHDFFTNQELSTIVDNFHCVGYVGHSSNNENISNEVPNVRNNLDADYLPQQNAQTSSQSCNNTSTNSIGSFNIPITYSFNLSNTGNEPVCDEEKVVLRKRNDDGRSSIAQIIENEKHETQATAYCSPEDVLKASSELSCCENGCCQVDHDESTMDSKSCTCVVCSMKSKSCITDTVPQLTSPVNNKCVLSSPQDSPVHVSCGSGFAMRVRCATLPRKKQQDSEDPPQVPGKRDHKIMEKKQNRKFGFRKGTLQDTRHIIQSQGLTLLSVVTNKLEEEKIDLCQEPYTDKTGFCGIPPALVQRYSEELQRDIYDVAEVLDQARINALHQQERKGIPNDFLADSCNEPVVEANYSCLRDWLTSLGLPMYTEHIQRAGYSQLEQIASFREADLRHCGINCSRHLRILTSAIGTLHIHLAKYGTG
ncbi:SAM and SH3 domain-containing protein 1-like isoform X2 [Tachypleus tridentatus]|uniref:SAM and SH3 domain-containing protein 1-like isoform X2 n=1 Tax=Tachypleus tridentatus TaxID=6853 RepID=UPI003FD50168